MCNHKDFKDYLFWMRLAYKKVEEAGHNIDAGLDYLRNGLKEIPLSTELLYNFAVSNTLLKMS